jgi:hypothetical protein
MGTILHVALQVIDDAKTLLTPFLPTSSDAVHRLLGSPDAAGELGADAGGGSRSTGRRAIGSRRTPVITGDYTGGGKWESSRCRPADRFRADPAVQEARRVHCGRRAVPPVLVTRAGPAAALPEPLPGEVVDSHCHLDAMGVDIGQSLCDAAAVGVTRVVTSATRWSRPDGVRTRPEAPQVIAAVAVHPNEVGGIDESTWDGLAALAARPRCGRSVRPDSTTTGTGCRLTATEAFRRHIALAKQARKGVGDPRP